MYRMVSLDFVDAFAYNIIGVIERRMGDDTYHHVGNMRDIFVWRTQAIPCDKLSLKEYIQFGDVEE